MRRCVYRQLNKRKRERETRALYVYKAARKRYAESEVARRANPEEATYRQPFYESKYFFFPQALFHILLAEIYRCKTSNRSVWKIVYSRSLLAFVVLKLFF
jgi:hypothetical protein